MSGELVANSHCRTVVLFLRVASDKVHVEAARREVIESHQIHAIEVLRNPIMRFRSMESALRNQRYLEPNVFQDHAQRIANAMSFESSAGFADTITQQIKQPDRL